MYYNEIDDTYLNQILDDYEAELAEGKHAKLLTKFIDIRREYENCRDKANEELENMNDMLNEIKDVLE